MQTIEPKNVQPMTFAGGPTYMPEYLKTALKQKLFGSIGYATQTTPTSMSTPTPNSSGKSSKNHEITCATS